MKQPPSTKSFITSEVWQSTLLCDSLYGFCYILTGVSKGFANSVNRLISSGHLTRSLKGSENAGDVISNIFQRSGVGIIPIGAKSLRLPLHLYIQFRITQPKFRYNEILNSLYYITSNCINGCQYLANFSHFYRIFRYVFKTKRTIELFLMKIYYFKECFDTHIRS